MKGHKRKFQSNYGDMSSTIYCQCKKFGNTSPRFSLASSTGSDSGKSKFSTTSKLTHSELFSVFSKKHKKQKQQEEIQIKKLQSEMVENGGKNLQNAEKQLLTNLSKYFKSIEINAENILETLRNE